MWFLWSMDACSLLYSHQKSQYIRKIVPPSLYKKTYLIHLQPNFTDLFSLNVLRTKYFANRCTLYFYKVSVVILEQFFFIMGPQTILLTLLREKKLSGLTIKPVKSVHSEANKFVALRLV